MKYSVSKENYLKAIFHLQQEQESVSTNALAEALQTKPASVTDMLKKLKTQKLLQYEKYRGVKLTADGKKVAIQIIRKHRMWEYFLVEKLQFGWEEVHEIAEELEHISSKKLIDRLEIFLDFPQSEPHGDPIPDATGKFSVQKSIALSSAKQKNSLIITGVSDHSSEFLKYLSNSGIALGDNLKIEESNGYDKSLKIKVNNKHSLFLSHKAASNILVESK